MTPVQAQAGVEAAATARWALKKAEPYSLPYGDIIMWSSGTLPWALLAARAAYRGQCALLALSPTRVICTSARCRHQRAL